MNMARILVRQGLAFRGDGDDKNGKFIKTVELLPIHCSIMKKWLDDKSMRL